MHFLFKNDTKILQSKNVYVIIKLLLKGKQAKFILEYVYRLL